MKRSVYTKNKSSDPVITGLFQYDAAQQISFEKECLKENNGREAALANVIREYMSDLKLSSEQELNIQHLANGSKVVIGGQQAGLFGDHCIHSIKYFQSLLYLRN